MPILLHSAALKQSKWFRRWTNRMIVLDKTDEGVFLKVCKGQNATVLNSIPMNPAVTSLVDGDSAKRQFSIKHLKQKYTFSVETDDMYHDWISTLEHMLHKGNNTLAVPHTLRPPSATVTESSLTIDSLPQTLSMADFKVAGKLGRGGYGSVLLGFRRNDRRQRPCAIKRIVKGISQPGDDESEKDFIKRLSKEGRKIRHLKEERQALEELSFPYLSDFYYAFEDDAAWYIASEYFPRGDLYKMMKRQPRKRYTEPVVKFWMAQLTITLEHLHERQWMHRDLKPENLLLDDAGRIRLIDFGLAKELGQCGGRTRTFCGTKYYMAPEMLEAKGYHDTAIDWWGMGVLMFELLTGNPPFTHNNRRQLYRQILRNPVEFPADVKATLSIEALSIITALLRKKPEQRLGVNGSVRNHPFFADVDWAAVEAGHPPVPAAVKRAMGRCNPGRVGAVNLEQELAVTEEKVFHEEMDILEDFAFVQDDVPDNMSVSSTSPPASHRLVLKTAQRSSHQMPAHIEVLSS